MYLIAYIYFETFELMSYQSTIYMWRTPFANPVTFSLQFLPSCMYVCSRVTLNLCLGIAAGEDTDATGTDDIEETVGRGKRKVDIS